MRKLLSTALLFLLPFAAHATVPEIPVNGIDDGASSGTAGACPADYMDAVIGSGCDLQWPATFRDGTTNYDRDGDLYGDGGSGFLSDGDCDDDDPTMYPGRLDESGCPAGQYRTCQSNGTFSSCAALSAFCDYRIDPGSGNDSNDGSYANPWASFGMISGGATGAPVGAVTPSAGDVICLTGSTDATTQFTDDVGLVHMRITGAGGTSGNKITIIRLPSSTAKIRASAGTVLRNFDADYIKLVNIEYSITNSGGRSVVEGFGVDGLELEGGHCYGSSGNGDNNWACFKCDGCNFTSVHHSYFINPIRATGNEENVSAIHNLDDGGVEGEGHYHYANTFHWDTAATSGNRVLRQKHGYINGATDAGDDGFRFYFARATNFFEFAQVDVSKLRMKYSIGYCDSLTPCAILDVNHDPYTTEDNEVEYNTWINATSFGWRLSDYASGAKLLWRRNVIVDNKSGSYATEDGIVRMDPYGTDAEKAQAESVTAFVADYNTYYGTTITPKFGYFAENGDAGGQYEFAAWQSNTGLDTNSHVEDPSHNAQYEPTATNSFNRGWLGDTPSLSPGGGGGGGGGTVKTTAVGSFPKQRWKIR